MDTSHFSIRPAVPADALHIVHLIDELAAYEHLADQSKPDSEMLAEHLHPGSFPRCEAFLATEINSGKAIGFALYFHNYSTFLTNFGLYLEDLYVQPDFRGNGIGFELLRRLAQTAVERKCKRLEWSVLDWNRLAIDFYRQIGAEFMKEWESVRLTGEALSRLAGV